MMGQYVFKLPDVGEGTAEAAIAEWHVAVGDRIEEDQPLVDLETDKAIVEVPAPTAGIILAIQGAVGDKIAVGSELVVIDTGLASEAMSTSSVGKGVSVAVDEHRRTKPGDSSGTAAAADLQSTRNASGQQATSKSDGPGVRERVVGFEKSPNESVPRRRALASPSVRQKARDLGIKLEDVSGSGPDGRVVHADLDMLLGARRVMPQREPQGSPTRQGAVQEIRIAGVRRRIAERMQESKRRIPHFAYVEEIDVTALEELRDHLNEKHAGVRSKLTPLPFVMRAIVHAVAAHPEINARFDDEKGIVHRHAAVHIGIAAQTPNGLMVPVVTNAHERDLWDCAAEVNRLAAVAREGRATRGELSGSTITITSLGVLGGIASTPIINYPEVAIVGLNRMAERPVVRNGEIAVRKMMNLSSSFDHRVVDGWNAAMFIQEVKRLLEQPATLFLD